MNPAQVRAAEKGTLASFAFIVLATIHAELDAPFKNFLAGTFGHHWVGKGILSLVVFGLVYYYFSTHAKQNGKFDAWKMAVRLALGAVLGGLIIFGFYVLEFLG